MSEEIVVSYCRSDLAACAGRTTDRLAALFSQSVFLDIDNIKPGTDFVERIENVIRSSKVAVILIGKDWSERLVRKICQVAWAFSVQDALTRLTEHRSTIRSLRSYLSAMRCSR